MEQEIKGRGVTRACSKCGRPLASRIKGIGWFSLHIFCANSECKSDEVISIGYKTIVSVASAALAVIFFAVGYTNIQANKITCKSFKSPDRTAAQARDAAQKFYDSDPVANAKLDGWDKDGKVCE